MNSQLLIFSCRCKNIRTQQWRRRGRRRRGRRRRGRRRIMVQVPCTRRPRTRRRWARAQAALVLVSPRRDRAVRFERRKGVVCRETLDAFGTAFACSAVGSGSPRRDRAVDLERRKGGYVESCQVLRRAGRRGASSPRRVGRFERSIRRRVTGPPRWAPIRSSPTP